MPQPKKERPFKGHRLKKRYRDKIDEDPIAQALILRELAGGQSAVLTKAKA